ncbi:hypothetical protein H4R21_007189, partial [Coemansia helicoidea]
TRYGSVVQVIDEFVTNGGDGAPFSPFLPTLRTYASNGNGAVAGLDGFCGAWKAVADAHPGTFLKAQKSVVERVYGAVATRYAQDRGIRYGLTKAALLDIAIVNGVGGGDNTIDEIVRGADATYDPSVSISSGSKIRVNGKEADEISWLVKLLSTWQHVNPAAMSHITVFLSLYTNGHFTFDSKEPFTVRGYAGS